LYVTTLAVIEPEERRLSEFMRKAGINVDVSVPVAQTTGLALMARPPSVLVVDLRGEASLPAAIVAFRRQYPRIGVILVASAMDPQLMLEAMRAGVNEFVTEPLSADDLRAAIERLTGAEVEPAQPARVLAFVGAKGGVGTTTLAVNTATALAAGDKGNVAIVDMHLSGHGDVALLLGVEPKFSVADAIENTERLDSAYLKTLVSRSKIGLDVLASPDRPLHRSPDAGRIRVLLTRLAERYKVVVLDVPCIEFGVLDSLDPLSSVTLVLNQELPTIRRAARIGELLRQRYGKDRVGTVVSRYDSRADIGQEDIEKAVGLPVWAALPSDYRKVLAAANAGRPLVCDNHTRLAASIEELARRLGGSGVAQAEKPARPRGRLGFF
jgi:pilus assembly protein CpaE